MERIIKKGIEGLRDQGIKISAPSFPYSLIPLSLFFLALSLGGCQKAWNYRIQAATEKFKAAKVLMEKKEWKKAVGPLKTASKDNPFDSDIWHQLGICYQEIGEKGWARDMYKRSLELDPGNSGAHIGLGMLDWQKDWHRAEKEFVAAYKLAPREAATNRAYPLQHAMAVYFRTNGYTKKEIESRKIIRELYPDWAEKTADLADAYNLDKNYNEAVEYFEKTLSLLKDKRRLYERPYIGLAWAYFNLGMRRQAAQALDEAFKLNHWNGLGLYIAGLLSWQAGEISLAQKHLRSAANNCDDGRPLIALAELSQVQGNYDAAPLRSASGAELRPETEAARQYLDLAARRFDKDDFTLNELGIYYEKNGRFAEAVDFTIKAAQLAPENWRYRCRLYEISMAGGSEDKAWWFFKECERCAPNEEIRNLIYGELAVK